MRTSKLQNYFFAKEKKITTLAQDIIEGQNVFTTEWTQTLLVPDHINKSKQKTAGSKKVTVQPRKNYNNQFNYFSHMHWSWKTSF